MALTFLRLVPALSATATLTLAWDQQWMLSVFTRPELERSSSQYLPAWFDACFRRGLPQVLGFLTVTVATSLANLRVQPALLRQRGAYLWYAGGAALAAGHLLFVPAIAPSVRGIIEDRPGGKSVDEMRRWLRVNRVRSLTTDLGAWAFCVVAVLRTFSP